MPTMSLGLAVILTNEQAVLNPARFLHFSAGLVFFVVF